VIVAIEVRIDGKRVETREGDLLFTHRGFSGPVILDVSRHVTGGGGEVSLRAHWGGKGVNWNSILSQPGRGTVGSVCRRILPDRLANTLFALAGVDSTLKLSELRKETRERLVETLETFELPVGGSEGYKTAEVTGGGIPLSEVVPATLESRLVPGLYFCGEMLDTIGGLGGYNFLWAWVTGRKVGRAIGASVDPATRTSD
jgi:predicted Rossmann fold flavoprotein